MNYKRLYNKIIEKHGTTTRNKGEYRERHHIVPKSVGGSDESDNLIYLPARVHFVCHRLLCKIYDSGKLKFAFWAMCNQLHGDVTRDYKVSARTYEVAKKHFAIENSKLHKGKKMSKEWCEALSKRMKGNVINPAGPSNPLYGRPRPKEVLDKIKATKAAKPENSNMFKGYYITPDGKFPSARLAHEASAIINNETTIKTYCNSPDKIVTVKMTYRKLFKQTDVGKSLRELGWDFLPVER
jgi:hypothetical protein